MSPYLQYKSYMIKQYGHPLFRVPIDFNWGCPNRSEDGTGGCSFCNVQGSKAVQTQKQEEVAEQVEEAMKFSRNRYGAKKYMAYIQAFSATFERKQQPLYLDLLDNYDFDAVSIGTRPDCLNKEAYQFLEQLNEDIEVWVELGVQTTHDVTLKRINRGHSWAASEYAIKKLHEHGIKVAVHVILGLPGETPEDYQKTADTLAQLPIDAIKVHNLHIEKGTTLAKEVPQPPTLMEYQFGEYLMDFIRRMPPTIPIMRLTTDSLKENLIAPLWNMSKGQFKDYIIQQMNYREWKQGDLFPGNQQQAIEPTYKVVPTEDGSVTFWNDEYKEHYHSPAGARLEATEKYSIPGQLSERLNAGPVNVLDICFGLGYNSLCALNLLKEHPHANLSITALEMDRRVVHLASNAVAPQAEDFTDWKKTLHELYLHEKAILSPQASITMHWGDARFTATQLIPESYDLIFLDAFSTQRNSQLWTVDFFKTLKGLMKPNGVLLTYCAALPVRAGLMEAGFFVGETTPIGRKRGGTIAALQPDLIQLQLPEDEVEAIQETSRGLSYRDPYAVWTNKEILRDRQERILTFKNEI